MFLAAVILALCFIGTFATTGVDVSQRTYRSSWGKKVFILFSGNPFISLF
jgi:hypothetical protein